MTFITFVAVMHFNISDPSKQPTVKFFVNSAEVATAKSHTLTVTATTTTVQCTATVGGQVGVKVKTRQNLESEYLLNICTLALLAWATAT